VDLSVFPWARVVDLSHPLGAGSPSFPGDPTLRLSLHEEKVDDQVVWRRHDLSLSDHAGTHMDAPLHFFPDGRSVDRIAPAELLLDAVTIDLRERCHGDGDYRITVRDLEAWEEEHGWIPAGSAVVLNTGWAFRWAEPARYYSLDEAGVSHTPGLGGEAAEFLAVQRRVRGVGIDAPSIDVGRTGSFPAHKALLGAGCWVIENLNHLHLLPPTGCLLLAAPLRLEGASGSPCRVFALLNP